MWVSSPFEHRASSCPSAHLSVCRHTCESWGILPVRTGPVRKGHRPAEISGRRAEAAGPSRRPLRVDRPAHRRGCRRYDRCGSVTAIGELDKLTIERIYLVTSPPPGAATGSEPAAWIRGHRLIENQLHHVRDRTFREDASMVRTWRLPHVMAGLGNLGRRRPPPRWPHQHRRRPPSHRPQPSAAPHHPPADLTNPDTRSLCAGPARSTHRSIPSGTTAAWQPGARSTRTAAPAGTAWAQSPEAPAVRTS